MIVLRTWHLAGALLLAAMPQAASAQGSAPWPERTVQAIVPFAAGAANDIVGRIVLEQVSKQVNQPIVVENRPGAGGTIGVTAVGKAPPNGHTLLVHSSSFSAAYSLYKSLPYDTLNDFTAVVALGKTPTVLVTSPGKGFKTAADLIAAAKAKPGAISFASQGTGVAPHLMMEMIKKAAGIDMVHVPYRGSAPALNDLVAGNVPLMMDSMITGLPHVRAGTLKGLAVSTAKRSSLAPDIPTVAESGIPGFEAFLWYGIVAPAQTPGDIVQKLGSEIAAVMKLPEIRERLIALGSEPAESGPESFAAFIKSEAEKWGPIVVSSGARAE